MQQMDHWTWAIAGVVTVAILFVLAFRLSPRARLRRRLKKTHSRIVSKARRPSVQLSVKTPKE